MANAWYEFDTSSKWKPYVGGGAGIAWVKLDGKAVVNLPTYSGASTTSVHFDGDKSGFAWQVGGGLGYEFKPNRQLTLDYRYFRGPKVDEMNVSVGGAATVIDPQYEYEAQSIMLGFKAGFKYSLSPRAWQAAPGCP